MFQVSATQIDTFRKCPQQWYNFKVLKLPQSKAQSLELGSRVHELIELYYLKKEVPSKDEVWRFAENTAVFYPGRIAQGMISGAIPAGVPVLPELEFELTSVTPGVTYTGKIDAPWLDADQKTAHIVDHKTSADPEKWGKKEGDLHLDSQKLLYCRAILERWSKVERVTFTLNYGSTKLEYRKNYFVTVEVSAAQIRADFAEHIEPVVKQMALVKENGAPEKNPEACGLFGGCQFKSTCKISTSARIGALMSNSKVAELLARVKKQQTNVEEDPMNPPEAAGEPQNPGTGEAPPVEAAEDKPKRTRRTKAEIEAARAAEAAPVTEAEAEPEPEPRNATPPPPPPPPSDDEEVITTTRAKMRKAIDLITEQTTTVSLDMSDRMTIVAKVNLLAGLALAGQLSDDDRRFVLELSQTVEALIK